MPVRFICLVLAALLLARAPARAAEQDEALRPEVGKPLLAAEELIKQQKFREALTQIGRAEAAAPLTARETSVAEQLRGIAAAGAGDNLTAARAFEAAIASGKLASADQLRLTQAVAGLYYQVKDYPKAITWAKRYQAAGGADEKTRVLLIQAYYFAEDWADAATALKDLVATTERAGRAPTEPQLQLLAKVEISQNNTQGYEAALEKLVVAYPKRDYWADLIRRVTSRPGFPHRLTLDGYRLSRAVGALSSAAQYTEAAELALQAGLPGEAKSLLEQGFAAGVLGSGPEAARQQRLLALAAQKAADDLKSIADSEKDAASAVDGVGLVNIGLDILGHGQPQQAVRLIDHGIAKGVAKNPDDARLHLGIALDAAGQKEKSLQTFRSLQSGDTADLARLWAIHVGQR